MKLANLAEWGPYPYHLQNPNGRMLATAADLLKHHGYTHLATELKELATDLLATKDVYLGRVNDATGERE